MESVKVVGTYFSLHDDPGQGCEEVFSALLT